MRIILLAILFPVVMASCSSWGEIKVENLNRENKKIIHMSVYHTVLDSYLDNAQTRYSRIIEKDKIADVMVNFHFYTYYYEPMLSDIGYLLIDDVSYKVAIVNPQSEAGNTKKFVNLTGEIMLTSKLEQAIIQANSLRYRLYSGRYPVTLAVSDKDLASIKRFLQHKGTELK